MAMLDRILWIALPLGCAIACASSTADDSNRHSLDNGHLPTDGDGGPQGPPPGGTLADEQYPPELLQPYTGPANTDYDNTVLVYDQLRSRVKQVFADTGI